MNTLLSFFLNWKTTSAGIAAILVALGGAFTQLSHGSIDTSNIATAVTAVLAGVGLIMAKDSNVSGTPTLTTIHGTGTSPVAVPPAA